MRFSHENYLLVKEGRKTATSRPLNTLKYYQDRVGHRAYAIDSEEPMTNPDIPIRILEVSVKTLAEIRDNHYKEEGYNTPAEFHQVWCKIYGANRWHDSDKKVFIRFMLESEWKKKVQK